MGLIVDEGNGLSSFFPEINESRFRFFSDDDKKCSAVKFALGV